MNSRKQLHFLAILTTLAISLLIASCASNNQSARTPKSSTEPIQATRTDKESVFKPPTMPPETALAIPSPTLTTIATATIGATPRPSATAICSDSLLFIEDLTIPDGSQLKAADAIDKRWLVENNGTCNWGAEYRLRLIEGPSLGAASEQALYPAISGTQAIIRILFQAPAAPGLFRSAWQAHSPNGEAFGDIIYIDIQVIE